MAVSNQEVAAWLAANPGATDAQIAQAAQAAGVSPQQLAQVTGVPVEQVQTRINAAMPPQAVAPQAPTEPWNYESYLSKIKSGDADYMQELGKLGGVMGQNAQNVYREILAQQNAGTESAWAKGKTASPQAAAADFALRLAEKGISSLSQVGQGKAPDYVDLSDGQSPVTPIINKATGEPIDLGSGGALKTRYAFEFTPDGTAVPFTTQRESDWVGVRDGFVKPAAALALATVGAPMLGAALAPAASAATQAAIGGAIAGGGGAALTGGNVLQGALLGGAGGYFAGANAAPAQDSIYSLANGTPNLNYMGGGQGLTSTSAANLASMGGGQGLQILAGLPSTTLAEALSTFGGVNPAVLDGMGLGSGIAYVTPSGIVTQNGTIIGGNTIGELGGNTGFDLNGWLNENVGAGIGDSLAGIDTGVSGLLDGAAGGAATGGAAAGGSGLTASQVANIAKPALGLLTAGAAGAAGAAVSNSGKGQYDIVPIPSDWKSPTYGQTSAYPALPPIDFGTPEMLRGTQWEKYLNPAPAPAPVQPPQGGMTYNQLQSILKGGTGTPPSLDNIISGIQSQYGQNPSIPMG